MTRPAAALAATALGLAAAGGAMSGPLSTAIASPAPGTVTFPVTATTCCDSGSPAAGPLAAVRTQATVDRDGRRMTLRAVYRMPPGVTGVVPVEWRAFSGPRSARTLAATGHGVVRVPISDGVLHVTRRARLGAALDRSGGFCLRPDFAAVGVAPVEPGCMSGPRHRRASLTAHVPEAIVFGDSVAAALDWVPGTREAVAKGMSVRFDLRTCRRLIAAPCPPGPPSALESIRSLPGSLGDIAVVDVGYNDWAATYDVPRVLRALRARGVDRVVWVLLRETQSSYSGINAEIRAAARRSDDIQVADWGRAGRGRSWFGADGVHLTTSGGWGLAGFLRAEMRDAVRALREEGHPS